MKKPENNRKALVQIHYLVGDATDPVHKPTLLCHVTNNIGAWGKGFVVALSKKDRRPEQHYRKWYRDREVVYPRTFELGAIQIAPFQKGVQVANMIAQVGLRKQGNRPPIRYEALESCLISAYRHASSNNLSVSMPRIGCELAGGKWEEVEEIIKRVMTVKTYVYTLPNQKDKWDNEYEKSNEPDGDPGNDTLSQPLSDYF